VSYEQPDPPESRKSIDYCDDRPSPTLSKSDNLLVLSEQLSERVVRQKQIVRGKYMNSHGLKVVSGAGNGSRPEPISPVAVLQELFELLEDYSPVWYSQENHDRAVAALEKRL
jgi:hypothetical protein